MKNTTALSSKWFGLGLGLLAGIAVLEIATPSHLDAQGSGSTRRERRRDSLQDTFTGWDQLGSTNVSSATSDQTINVASGAGASDRIRLRVESSSIVINQVIVTYVDGERYEAGADLSFSNSQRSHEIDLPGTAKAIQSVAFHTANLPNGQTAQIELWSR